MAGAGAGAGPHEEGKGGYFLAGGAAAEGVRIMSPRGRQAPWERRLPNPNHCPRFGGRHA
jgi:hypothetical protein